MVGIIVFQFYSLIVTSTASSDNIKQDDKSVKTLKSEANKLIEFVTRRHHQPTRLVL